MKALVVAVFLFITIGQTSENVKVDTLATINSLKVYDNVQSMEFFGDYEEILQTINSYFTGKNFDYLNFNCSTFSGFGNLDNIFYGRNFDNYPPCDLLVGKYNPPGKYSSIASTRISDVGLNYGTNYANLAYYQKTKLLASPFFAADGFNECGLTTALSWIPPVTIQVDPNKESIFITLLVRRILDGASNIQEALEIANSYNVFDSGNCDQIQHHLLITDASGNSIVIEYIDDQFIPIKPDENWQVATNTGIFGNSMSQMCSYCWRFNSLYNDLSNCNGMIENWRHAFDILSAVSVDYPVPYSKTEWSTITDLNEKKLYVVTDRDYLNVAMADINDFELKNCGNFTLVNKNLTDGNSNGIIESMEMITMDPEISVPFTATGVEAVLSSDSEDVIIGKSDCYYGNIYYGLNGYPNEPFCFHVLENGVGQEVNFKITFTTDYGFSYELDFPMVLTYTDIDEFEPKNCNLVCYPNPFNPSTTINFSIQDRSNVELKVFNCSGVTVDELVNSQMESGTHSVVFNAEGLASGTYYCSLKIDGIYFVKPIMFLK
ncbi:MAG: linear amide C-N hydrolase [Candidatus Delongbacteria bacterium]|nr:linear amide C-N hydrolase [Candidatus Delongbacteria bacterium]MBN2833653.1 linear amide C-N hydrolase [Candidatus Delongbacteria bacterium]